MSEKIKFRKSVIGGFDRHDVIGYIKSLAEERNELQLRLDGKSALDDDGASQIQEVASAQSEFEIAGEVLRELEARHEELGEQIRDIRRRLEAMRPR